MLEYTFVGDILIYRLCYKKSFFELRSRQKYSQFYHYQMIHIIK